jgi:hypothetical protein
MLFKYKRSKNPKYPYMVELDSPKFINKFGSSGWGKVFYKWMSDNGYGVGEAFLYKRNDDLDWLYDTLKLHRESWSGLVTEDVWFKDENQARKFDQIFGINPSDSKAISWLQKNAKKWESI